MYSVAGDLVNQCGNVNKSVAALTGPSVEFVVVHDHFLTPTAQYADIVLPATTSWERNDIHLPWSGAGHYAIFMRQAIPPVGECRNDLDICAELARRLGLAGYGNRTEEEWLRAFLRGQRHRRLRRLPRAGSGATAGARRRRGLRARGAGARTASVLDAVGEDRAVLAGVSPPIRTPTGSGRSRRSRPGFRSPETDSRWPLELVSPEVAAARTPRTTTSRSSREPTARTSGSTPTTPRAEGSRTARRSASSTTAGAPSLPAHVTDRITPGVVSIKEGAWFTPGATGGTRTAARTS